MKLLKDEILYRSIHRGCKETDHLIGGYVAKNIDKFDEAELLLLKEFIVEDDMLIYDWILGKAEFAPKYGVLIEKMRKFHSIG
jgi:antitoxin CptB